MMERLLEIAQASCDEAEIYSLRQVSNVVLFAGETLNNIDSKLLSGISLRIIKDNQLGFAYTRNLTSRQELLDNALDSLRGGIRAEYNFPYTQNMQALNSFDSSIENLSNTEMAEECKRIIGLLQPHANSEIQAGAFTTIKEIRIINSAGTDLSSKIADYGIYANMSFPGSKVGIWRVFKSNRYAQIPEDIIEEMIVLYGHSSRIANPSSGKMKVLFMPGSMLVFTWRIVAGISPQNVYNGISPIAKKLGEKIFDDKITIVDDPTNDAFPGARSFDDEGVACKPLTLVENGVLKDFYYDLHYAQKMNTRSSGHGYKTELLFKTKDHIAIKPMAAPCHLFLKTGEKTFPELVKSIDKGIIVDIAQSFHSGNIPNGDYSIGVSSGFYVEDGQIVGRIKDAMISGNIYNNLKYVQAVGDKLYPGFDAWVPAVLLDNINVTFG